MESILTSVKQYCGITEEDEAFDSDIVDHINSVFMDLHQLGVGPIEGFHIEDKTTLWTDFISDLNKFQAVKSYVKIRVKLLFDPPASSALLESLKQSADRWEWRLNVAAETDMTE